MAGDVTSLDSARRMVATDVRTGAASDYVRRAEEALALLSKVETPEEKAAVCRLAETWLNLAEAELNRPAER